ncbi:DUF4168 domain-containing protein [Egbenema bharatensis]|uniref:DUF4168 domain-containing protein n=1 Tax=Egbenema bharatensis TaxID=3463334 RepID=UPI003A87B95C
MNNAKRFRSNPPAILTRSLLVGGLATAGLLMSLVPTVNVSAEMGVPQLSFSRAAYAQAVTDEEVTNYARSVLEMEPIRRSAFERIRQITGSSNIPEIKCDQPRRLNDLPSDIRQIAINYCDQARNIAQRNNLTIRRFNAITIAHQEDPDLSNRIQQAILQLQ